MNLIPEEDEDSEPMDGDWCLVDLSDEPVEEATRVAHAFGMNFEQFMHIALEEKLAKLRGDPELARALEKVRWNRCSNSSTSGESSSRVARMPHP